MKLMKKDWLKVLAIVIFCGFLDMLLHALFSPLSSDGLTQKPSVFVKLGLTVPAILVWELLAFGVLAMVFLLIQSRLPGTGRRKGILYGLSFGGLYQIGMLESVLLLKSSVWNELFMGLADFIPILLLGLLIGIFAGTTTPQNKRTHLISSVCIISIFYLAGRYLAYSVFHIQSVYAEKPLETFLWTLSMGFWIGVIYYILESGSMGKSVFTKGMFFGVVIFGSNWLMNHLFIAVVSKWSPDILLRAGTDIVFTSVGAFVCRKMFKQYPSGINEKSSPRQRKSEV